MGVLQQAGLGCFKDSGDGQKKSPGAHLIFRERPSYKHYKIDQAEEGYGEPLQDSKEGRTNPVRGEIFFQR